MRMAAAPTISRSLTMSIGSPLSLRKQNLWKAFEGGQVIPLNRLASLAQLPDVGAIIVAGGRRTHLELN